MNLELTAQQRDDYAAFHVFAGSQIAPYADRYDQEEQTPLVLIAEMARKSYLGALIPRLYGGSEMDMITFGLLNEAIGGACSSLRSLLTVQNMIGYTIARWGSKEQKSRWLPEIAAGKIIVGFCLSEPEVGSDAKSIETTATPVGDDYVLHGHKKWITYGQIAHLFLVFARCNGQHVAFLVERDTPGLTLEPICGLLGLRASMLAEVRLETCRVPRVAMLGSLGFGLTGVAVTALDIGRYSVAWGCVGIAQACLDAALRYTNERKQFGAYLREHQLIQQMIADMITHTYASRLLCYRAGALKDSGHHSSMAQTQIAKYFAATTAAQAASHAVQIHGANGCSSQYPVQRYLRDAKIMEIIEGSTQIQQIAIAKYAHQEYRSTLPES